MVIDENDNEDYNTYMTTVPKKITTKEIVTTVITILLIFILIGLIMITKNSIGIISEYKIYEQYETQVAVLQKQEQARQAKTKIEKKKQEKLPKLTQERKRQDRKYLSCRNQKSIFDF